MSATLAEGQPFPRGPEVAIDRITRDCPSLVRQEGGRVALAYSRFEAKAQRERIVIRIQDFEGALGPATSIARDSEGFLDVQDFVAVPSGLRLVWRHLARGSEIWGQADLDPRGRLRHPPQALRRIGIGPHPQLAPRPVGGFVEYWSKGRTLSVRILDDDLRPVGETQEIAVPHAAGALLLQQATGSFVVLVKQELWRPYRGIGFRAQRFDVGGRAVGPLLRLVPPHRLWKGLRAAVGDDGALALAVDYGDLFGAELLTLWTFAPDGSLLSLRGWYDRERRSSSEAVVIDPQGRVLWVWHDSDATKSYRAQVSTLAGEAVGGSFAVPTLLHSATGLVGCATADWTGDDWVVTWSRYDPKSAADTAYVRRFAR